MKRHDNGVMPPELREELERHPPDTRRDATHAWHLLGETDEAPLEVPSTDEAWLELDLHLSASEARPARHAGPRRRRGAADRSPSEQGRRLRGLMAVTGILTVLLAVVTGYWQRPVTVLAPPGAQQTVQLPDGSTVELNSGTRLSYARGFSVWPFVPAEARTVALDGEAFFEVVEDGRPFVVETFNAHIEVLGTRFNVRARREPTERSTAVTLASGRVRVHGPAGARAPVLLEEPGATAVVADAVPEPALQPAPPLDRVLAWRRRGFAAHDRPLAALVAEVERRYALTVDVEDPRLAAHSLSVFYPRGTDAEQILHDVCLAAGCRYRPTSTGFALYLP